MKPKGLQTYQRTSVTTADRRKIVTMLYEGLVANLNAAITAIEAGDTPTRSAKIQRSLEIIQFLSAALDFDKGGDIARNLSNLYDYTRDTITLGNITGDVAKLREAIELFNILLDGWRQIGDSAETPAGISLEPPRQKPVELKPKAPAESSPSMTVPAATMPPVGAAISRALPKAGPPRLPKTGPLPAEAMKFYEGPSPVSLQLRSLVG